MLGFWVGVAVIGVDGDEVGTPEGGDVTGILALVGAKVTGLIEGPGVLRGLDGIDDALGECVGIEAFDGTSFRSWLARPTKALKLSPEA